MNATSLLRYSILVSFLLVIAIYLLYRSAFWPAGRELAESATSLLILALSFAFLQFFKKKPIVAYHDQNIRLGIVIGLLWTIEIAINNVVHPLLPARDIIDNAFWITIAAIILIVAIVKAYKNSSVVAGIISGFWTGSGSGAIACLTALLLIVFGMPLILKDPLNIKEWNDVRQYEHSRAMTVYFAYETLAGAIMHLVILGTLMGLVLGMVGGILGKLFASN